MDLVFAPSEIETWPIDRLRPYARNAKMHGDDQVAKIAASMAKFGWTVPCMVADDGELIAGHGRVLAATMRNLPAREWHRSGFALVAVFLLVGKVWSPQFTLWLLPLAVLAWPGWPLVVALTVADAAVHVTRFRWLANFVAEGLPGAWPEWPFLTAVLVRDLVVVLMVAAWWRRVTDPGVPSTGPVTAR